MKMLVGISAAADTLSIGKTKLRELLKQGSIRSVRIGRRRLVLREDVDALVQRALRGHRE